jgi:hypothetical protein
LGGKIDVYELPREPSQVETAPFSLGSVRYCIAELFLAEERIGR